MKLTSTGTTKLGYTENTAVSCNPVDVSQAHGFEIPFLFSACLSFPDTGSLSQSP